MDKRGKIFYVLVKRISDVIISFILFIITLPLLIVFSIWIWIETKQFPIYHQKRGLVLDKNLFRLYKLRTLKSSNDKLFNSPDIFIKDDLSIHVTYLGRWLRKTGLDELPQLINVLLGNMSLIGPRPFSLSDLEKMKLTQPQFYERRKDITSKPGITGLWQTEGDRTKGFVNLLELEEYYDKHKGFSVDIKILFNTVCIVLSRNNSDSIVLKNKNE